MAHTSETSVGGLLRGALDDVRDLFREELALAKAEMRQEISKASAAAAQFGAAGVSLWFATMFLLVSIALGASVLFNWPVWATFGGLAVLLAIVGFALIVSGRSTAREVRAMPRTTESIKENFR